MRVPTYAPITAAFCAALLLSACAGHSSGDSVAVAPQVQPLRPISNFDRFSTGRFVYHLADKMWLHDGLFWAASMDSCWVQGFDERGEVRQAFGRQGPGPGELETIGDMVASGEHLYVVDQVKNRIFDYDWEGREAAAYPLPELFYSFHIDSESGHLYGSSSRASSPIVKYDLSSGEAVGFFKSHDPDANPLRDLRDGAYHVFGYKGNIIAVSMGRPHLNIYSLDGQLLRHVPLENERLLSSYTISERYDPPQSPSQTLGMLLRVCHLSPDGQLLMSYWGAELGASEAIRTIIPYRVLHYDVNGEVPVQVGEYELFDAAGKEVLIKALALRSADRTLLAYDSRGEMVYGYRLPPLE